jgi:hypothetical protein
MTCFPIHARTALLGCWASLLLLACAPSEEEVRADFDEFLTTRTACASADECVLVYPGCPLGCAVAVHRDFETETRSRAAELIDDYESGGRACAYDCLAMQAACSSGRCEAVPLEQ